MYVVAMKEMMHMAVKLRRFLILIVYLKTVDKHLILQHSSKMDIDT